MSLLFDMENEKKSIIKVVGVGGGGSNAVNYMYNKGIVGVDFAICNTDSQAMLISDVPVKIHLGPQLTDGMGAGNMPEKGRQACIESIDEVRAFLDDNTKMLFLTAGLGGGTGTGATPIIAKAAQEMDILTVAIITLPFTFEGGLRRAQGLEGLEELKKNVDAYIVIGNDKLREMFGNKKLSEAFAHADSVLATAAKGIAEIITVAGNINVDFQDVNTVMKNSGVAIMGTGVGTGENRAKTAVQMALASPLLEDNDIRGAKNILLNISSGQDEVSLDEIYTVTEFIQDEAGYGTSLIWGNCKDENLDDELIITIIATGFEKGYNKTEGADVKKVVLEMEDELEHRDPVPEIKQQTEEETNALNFPVDGNEMKQEFVFNIESKNEEKAYSYDNPYMTESEKEEAERRKLQKAEREKLRRAQFQDQVTPPGSLDANDIQEKEKIPAYARRHVKLDEVITSDNSNVSRWTLSMDDDGPVLNKEGNSFLHDNVD